MKQVILNQTQCPFCGLTCGFLSFSKVFSKNILIFLWVLSSFNLIACKNKSIGSTTNISSPPNHNNTAPIGTNPMVSEDPKLTGFPSLQEFIELLGNDPQYVGFARLLHEDFLLKYINIREQFDFVFFVPNEKNQDPTYIKTYLSNESTPMDKNAFWLSHIAVSSKGMPFEGNPTIYQVMLKRNNQIISYEGGSTNIISEKKLKDGTQIIFIDKPINIPIRK
ncbi:MAG: hypothetical protein ABIO44_09005 [Saprospiraceae bacterium]